MACLFVYKREISPVRCPFIIMQSIEEKQVQCIKYNTIIVFNRLNFSKKNPRETSSHHWQGGIRTSGLRSSAHQLLACSTMHASLSHNEKKTMSLEKERERERERAKEEENIHCYSSDIHHGQIHFLPSFLPSQTCSRRNRSSTWMPTTIFPSPSPSSSSLLSFLFSFPVSFVSEVSPSWLGCHRLPRSLLDVVVVSERESRM